VRPMDMGFAESPRGAWTPYITMEFLDGDPLEKVIDVRVSSGKGPFSIAETIELLDGAVRAIGEAHKLNITHRDIKPANIHSTSVAGKSVFKILDFGIAKVMTENAGLTRALQATGNDIRSFTARYGAPEQFSRRMGATGPWTDVYALALLFIEMVTGRPALDGDDIQQLYVASTDKEARPSLRGGGVTAPEAVEKVLQVALSVEPRQRYLSATEFWEALIAASSTCATVQLAQQTAVTMTAPMNLEAMSPAQGAPAASADPSKAHPISYAQTLPAPGSNAAPAGTTAPATSATAPTNVARPRSSPLRIGAILGAVAVLMAGIGTAVFVFGSGQFTTERPAAARLPAGAKPRPVEQLEPKEVKASSFISNAREKHPPQDAFDGEKRTAWNESAKGPGTGEWIEASWPAPRRIRRVLFSTGFDHVSAGDGDLFGRNAHLKTARLVFSDGTVLTRQIPADQREIEVSELNVVSTSLRLVAHEVWPGTSWQDLCVSEIRIWADPAED